MKSRILKNTSAYILVGLAPYLVNFFMLPVYTRYLTPSEYGMLSLVAAFQIMLALIISLQLGAGLGRFYFDYDENGTKLYFSTIFYSIVIISLFFLLIFHALGDRLTGLIFSKANIPYAPYFLLALILVFLSNINTYSSLLLQVSEKAFSILRISVVSILAGVGFGVYFVVLRKMGVYGYLLGNVCSSSINLCLLLHAVKGYFVLGFSRSMLKKTLPYSLPIIPHAIGGYLFMYSDRIVLEKFVTLGAIGLYNIADRISMILLLAVDSFNTANSPNFMRLSKEDKTKTKSIYKSVITKWAAAVSVFFLGMAFFSEELIQVMTPHKYHNAYSFLPILLGAYVFRGLYCFATNPLFFEKKTKVIPIITFVAGFLNVGLNLLIIPFIGVIGAAWSTLFSFVVTFLLALYFSNKYYPLEYDWGTLYELGIITTGIFLFVFFLAPDVFWIKALLKMFGVGILCLIIYRRDYGNVLFELKMAFGYISRKAPFIRLASSSRE